MRTHDPDFEPPFCPNSACRHHSDPREWRWVHDGTFQRKAPPTTIQRFRCVACRRCFSTQTFDTTYWLKRPELQRPLFMGLVACSGHRQLGRSLGAAATTLQRQAARLGRHCLLFQALHAPKEAPREPLELDGLVSFEYSQYYPFEINVLVGSESYFTYGFTESELRRSGRMTAAQKAKRAVLESRFGKADPQATRKAVRDLISQVAPQPAPLKIWSDEHQAYPRAFRDLPHDITHRTVSSRRCRSAANPLFRVDLLDLLVRHSGANHKRETIAFSKRRQAALERCAVTCTWRNFMKRVSERNLRSTTPAQRLGLQERALGLDDILHRRLFPTRVALPPSLQPVYWRDIETRQIANNTRHALRYAA